MGLASKKHSFRARPSSVSYRLEELSWSHSLTGWSNLFWVLTTSRSAKIDDSQRLASIKLIRKQIKKKGKLQIHLLQGKKVTTKPLGTRMGKGKGKFATFRWFSLRGEPHFSFGLTSSSTVLQIGTLLKKRTSTSLKVSKLFF